MNYLFKKNSRFYRKPNERYFIKFDKSEIQNNINKNNNIYNQKNISKSNNIFNNNFFALNRIINTKEIMLNYNGSKNENSKKYPGVRASHSIENNLKYLNKTNIKNIPQKPSFSFKKQINDIDENKNSDNKESIPTIVKIQKLIECLEGKSTTNNISKDNNKDSNENNKLPNLINVPKPLIEENKPHVTKQHKSAINNINIFSSKDLISRVNNTKIKLKQINNNKINKNNNKKAEYKEKTTTNHIETQNKNIFQKKRMPKVSLDKVKNIIKQNYIVDNNGNKEKVVNIRLKLNPKQTRNYFNSNNNIISSNINNNLNNNTIFIKTKKENIKFCISNYNNFKSDLMGLKNTFHHIEKERTKKESLVNKNQTMFKNPLNDKKYREENEEDDGDEIENDPKRYSKYFLPSSGYGLLSRHNV